MRCCLCLLVGILFWGKAFGQQLEITADYVTSSTFKDHDGNEYGDGSLAKFSGKYDFLISTAINEQRRPIIWRGSVRAVYARLDNSGYASEYNPDQVLDAGFTLTHIRPLNDKWNIILSAGLGVYTTLDEYSMRDWLVNAVAIFVRPQSRDFQWGVGLAYLSTYAVPVILPMPYIRWTYNGRYEISVSMMGIGTVTAGMRINDHLKLNLDGLTFDNLSAIRRIDGKTKVYASTLLKSGFRPEYNMGKSTFYANIGAVWSRSTSIVSRSYKGFFRTFNKDYRKRFGNALDVSVGFRHAF